MSFALALCAKANDLSMRRVTVVTLAERIATNPFYNENDSSL